MPQYLAFTADLVAVSVLICLFLARHGRRDLIVAYLGVNVGVLAVTSALTASTVGAGLGLGLFGVLSIIRLRSQELAQHEIAYYFAALALGLLGGLDVTPTWLPAALMAAVVVVMSIGDHPKLAPVPVSQEILLDRAFTDGQRLTTHLEDLLNAEVIDAVVRRTDLVNDTTLVVVRYRSTATASVPTAAQARVSGA